MSEPDICFTGNQNRIAMNRLKVNLLRMFRLSVIKRLRADVQRRRRLRNLWQFASDSSWLNMNILWEMFSRAILFHRSHVVPLSLFTEQLFNLIGQVSILLLRILRSGIISGFLDCDLKLRFFSSFQIFQTKGRVRQKHSLQDVIGFKI